MLHNQLHSASSNHSMPSLCSSPSGGLSPAAAAAIAGSLTGNGWLQITAVRLTGSCKSLRLLNAAVSSSGSMHSHHTSTLLLSSGPYSKNLSAAIGTDAASFATVDTIPAAAAAAEQAYATATAAAAGDGVQLHIDFSIARDAPFFTDLVMQYSSSRSKSVSSTAQPSIWVQPTGLFTGQQAVRVSFSSSDEEQEDTNREQDLPAVSSSTGSPEEDAFGSKDTAVDGLAAEPAAELADAALSPPQVRCHRAKVGRATLCSSLKQAGLCNHTGCSATLQHSCVGRYFVGVCEKTPWHIYWYETV